MKKSLYDQIEANMLSCIKETVHDMDHVYRVLNFALYIAKQEQGVDYDVLIASALLHDIGRDGENGGHNVVGAEMARDFLKGIGFPDEKIDGVYHAIITHSNGMDCERKTLEAKILYDADKLEAIGVMGIARAFLYAGNVNNHMYVLENGKVDMDENAEDDTVVRYYLRHLQKNYDRFFTKAARELALRHKKEDEEYFRAFINFINENAEFADKLSNVIEE
ncbi:MAG: HD domain-containing protein [Eubacterium sp.]|nr:HD domain-containing protein [Eubacterium sp.]